MKKVSLIIPIYNVELYLEECLNSVVRQTLNEFEIICVDDGSTDRSGEIVDLYAANFPNIEVIHQKNKGVSNARNVGLDAAKGKYVCFLDSDDYIEESMLEELYQRSEEEQLEILYFNTKAFYENDELREKYKVYEDLYERNGLYEGVKTGHELYALMRNNKEFNSNMGIQFFARDFLIRNQLKFREGILYEDYLYTFQCVMLAKRAGYIDRILHHRRIRTGSIVTSPKTILDVECHIYTYIEALEFIRQLQIDENAKEPIRTFLLDNFRRGRNAYRKLKAEGVEPCLENANLLISHYFDIIQYEAKREEQIKELRAKNRKLKKQIENIKNSKSYRIGDAISKIPRKIKKKINEVIDSIKECVQNILKN